MVVTVWTGILSIVVFCLIAAAKPGKSLFTSTGRG